MPGMNSLAACHASWLDYDQFQHYFYDETDTGEDFYKSTAPSEDIWKKFELLPTPPMSPSRTLDLGSVLTPKLVASLEEDYSGLCELEPLDVFGNLSSIIIKDCMWSGLSASHQLEKVGQPLVPQNHKASGGVNVARVHRPSPGTPVSNAHAAQCVNPAAVLNLPVTHPKKTTTASSGAESRSDSSDDDEGDNEIDVVTVENRPRRGRPPGRQRRTPVTITVSADPHGPCPKHFHISLHRQQHNYAAPSPDSDRDHNDCEHHDDANALERPSSSSSSSSSPLSSPASSDSDEDVTEQRRNFLERKRRDDLRSRFQALRQEIPGLSDSAKTSKVAILTRAAEYLRQLRAKERRQAQERKKLRAKQLQLLRKITCLRNTHH